jgi:hypothetical protein
MKNEGYEYENFNHFFGFLILNLVESQIFRPFIGFNAYMDLKSSEKWNKVLTDQK